METISEQLLEFYRITFFLTQFRRLPWRITSRGKIGAVEAQITKEFGIHITYYKNTPGNAVIDFECRYVHTDREQPGNTETLSGRFREHTQPLFQLLNCRLLYEFASVYSERITLMDPPIDPYALLLELTHLKTLQQAWAGKDYGIFDAGLLEQLLHAGAFPARPS